MMGKIGLTTGILHDWQCRFPKQLISMSQRRKLCHLIRPRCHRVEDSCQTGSHRSNKIWCGWRKSLPCLPTHESCSHTLAITLVWFCLRGQDASERFLLRFNIQQWGNLLERNLNYVGLDLSCWLQCQPMSGYPGWLGLGSTPPK